jgi:tRNA (mo5U34)-methyltransferase
VLWGFEVNRVSDIAAQGRATSVARAVEERGPWFHNLHLPDGTQTAPNHFLGDFPAHKWKYLAPHLPTDLTGWRALDIGCNAGFHTFELARRGAEVTSIRATWHRRAGTLPSMASKTRWSSGVCM